MKIFDSGINQTKESHSDDGKSQSEDIENHTDDSESDANQNSDSGINQTKDSQCDGDSSTHPL